MGVNEEGLSIIEAFQDLDVAASGAYEQGDPYTIDLDGVRPHIRVDSMDPLEVHEYPITGRRRGPRFVGEVAVERLVWVIRRPFKNPTPYLVIPGEAPDLGEASRYGHRLANYDGKIMNEMFKHFGLPYTFAGFIIQDALYKNPPNDEPHLRLVK